MHAVAVEGCLMPVGFPDISYANGLIECKWLPAWPVRPSTVVPLRHFTNEQRIFMRKRSAVPCAAMWGVLAIGDEVLLFLGGDAHVAWNEYNRAELYDAAWKTWPSKAAATGEILHSILQEER